MDIILMNTFICQNDRETDRQEENIKEHTETMKNKLRANIQFKTVNAVLLPRNAIF